MFDKKFVSQFCYFQNEKLYVAVIMLYEVTNSNREKLVENVQLVCGLILYRLYIFESK